MQDSVTVITNSCAEMTLCCIKEPIELFLLLSFAFQKAVFEN